MFHREETKVHLMSRSESRLLDGNLVLEEMAASQHAGPSPAPGLLGSQKAPGAEAETSGTDRSGRKERRVSTAVLLNKKGAKHFFFLLLRCIIFESGPTNIGDVLLRRQAECRQVLGVALSETGSLLCLSMDQNRVRRD